jgi:hypothetical protein
MEALSSLLPNLPHMRIALTRTILSPILTTPESAPRYSRAFVIEELKTSREVPETPTVA